MALAGARGSANRLTRTAAITAILLATPSLFAQGRGGGRGGGRGAAPNPRAAAAFDPTGYWVSVVTEDWMYRMVTPPKGKYVGVPMNADARKIADAWDPAKDETEGNQCKAYGAPAIMRIPGRLHITWQDDNTLKIETDAGRQTRLLHFRGSPVGQGGDWQGVSNAEWEVVAGARGPVPGGGM